MQFLCFNDIIFAGHCDIAKVQLIDNLFHLKWNEKIYPKATGKLNKWHQGNTDHYFVFEKMFEVIWSHLVLDMWPYVTRHTRNGKEKTNSFFVLQGQVTHSIQLKKYVS